MRQAIQTRAQYDKLLDCEYLLNEEWTKAKFLKRGLATGTIVIALSNDTFVCVNKSVYSIKINGQILEYKSQFEFTNPKNPF